MFRYLKEAFWARPDIGGLGRIPWNAIAVARAIILGFGEHSVWIGGIEAQIDLALDDSTTTTSSSSGQALEN